MANTITRVECDDKITILYGDNFFIGMIKVSENEFLKENSNPGKIYIKSNDIIRLIRVSVDSKNPKYIVPEFNYSKESHKLNRDILDSKINCLRYMSLTELTIIKGLLYDDVNLYFESLEYI